MQKQDIQGPVILSEQRHVRYVQLAAEYGDDPAWHVAVRRTEAAYDGLDTSIYHMSSDGPSMASHLSGDELDLLVAGRLRYLLDRGMVTRHPLLEEAFAAYLQACGVQACQASTSSSSDDLFPDDDFPF